MGSIKHNLLVHAPLQYRLVSGEAINCEDEERVFKLIRNIVHCTSNNSQGHLIGNLIVRLEVEFRCTERYEFDSSNNSTVSEIHNLGANLRANERNSLFTYELIQENSADWQSHLERVSNFLIFENKWWKMVGLNFLILSMNPKIEINTIKCTISGLQISMLSLVNW